jgi:HlyD family secretion protein
MQNTSKTIFQALVSVALLLLTACNQNKTTYDASGAFEADEIIVSAEQTGKILKLEVEEGQTLNADQVVGQIDVNALNVQKEQTIASVNAISQKTNDAAPQINILQSQVKTQKAQIRVLTQQMEVLDVEIKRVENLLKAEAATPKQLDDLKGQKSVLTRQIDAAQDQIGVLNEQIAAARANVSLQNRSILSEVTPMQKRVSILDEQIARGVIKNMLPGTVLTKYAMAGEYTNMGKALYKIADLSTITLRAYITGNQLPLIKLNQDVKVLTDDGKGGMQETTGKITWINDKAEFTPKTIQTKDERANMVYAIKVKVPNAEGTYKIGMYGEIKFQ